jgi:oxygen-dependent protoporphyrinogen oxidase
MVASPVMREMEKESGSLIRATLGRMTSKKEGRNKPRFINFRQGMQQLPDTIAARLKGDLRLNARVTHIERGVNGYVVTLASGERMEAQALILATLANVSANLLQEAAPETSARLAQIDHENTGTISLVYREEDLSAKPLVNGLMIPRREKRAIDAMTVTSRKMPERSYPGFALVRVFFGGATPELIDFSEEKLLQTVTAELRDLLGIRSHPLAHAAFRWEAGFPQARVNHLQRVDEIEATLPDGIALAGSSYRGIAVPDCIRQGRAAARSAISAL